MAFTIVDTRPPTGVSAATNQLNKNQNVNERADLVGILLSIANAVNELQDIVTSLSATPVSASPIVL